MTILEELYMGKISFFERRIPPSTAYTKAMKNRADVEEKLAATLNEEEKQLLEQLGNAEGDICDFIRYDTYTAAFRLGVQLMAEIYAGDNRLPL